MSQIDIMEYLKKEYIKDKDRFITYAEIEQISCSGKNTYKKLRSLRSSGFIECMKADPRDFGVKDTYIPIWVYRYKPDIDEIVTINEKKEEEPKEDNNLFIVKRGNSDDKVV
jgi:hypothetical protein